MNKKLYALFAAALISAPAFATEEIANMENIQQFASLIRWSGVFFSVIIIAVTWLLLKFMSSMVESIGGQFAQYRMLLQKTQSFLQFLHLLNRWSCGVYDELSHQ